MISLGIDPGTRRIGYGIVGKEYTDTNFLAAGILKIESKSDIPALEETKREIDNLIKQFKPDVLVIEKLYFTKNQKTGIAVAQARGVVLLAAAECGIRIKEYAPNEIKLGITGYGLADKKAVFKMVKLILKKPDLKIIDDASDALAMAIMGCNEISTA